MNDTHQCAIRQSKKSYNRLPSNLQFMFLRVHMETDLLLRISFPCWRTSNLDDPSWSGREQRGLFISASVSSSRQSKYRKTHSHLNLGSEEQINRQSNIGRRPHLKLQSLWGRQIFAWLWQRQWQLSRPAAARWRSPTEAGSHTWSANPAEENSRFCLNYLIRPLM